MHWDAADDSWQLKKETFISESGISQECIHLIKMCLYDLIT